MKPKDNKKASHDLVDPQVDVKEITEEAFDVRELIYTAVNLAQPKPVAPKIKLTSVRLMTIFELLTDKSFPRKGPGKSTKVKILEAIITAAIDKKLKIQGA